MTESEEKTAWSQVQDHAEALNTLVSLSEDWRREGVIEKAQAHVEALATGLSSLGIHAWVTASRTMGTKFITLTDDPAYFGTNFSGDPTEINNAVQAGAERYGITAYRNANKLTAKEAEGEELDWFAQWCVDPNTDWVAWFGTQTVKPDA